MLFTISPIDGRYHSKTEVLRNYFSEFALIKYRVWVEIDYLLALADQKLSGFPDLSAADISLLNAIKTEFNELDAQRVKEIEKTTNHDVKAVEYFIRERLKDNVSPRLLPFIHFALTSQDINNTAVPLSLKNAAEEVIIPALKGLIEILTNRAKEWKDVPMLAKTHGQAASPTGVGKEIGVFAYRLNAQLEILNRITYSAKFGGATGNFNAHMIAYPKTNWHKFADKFVHSLGLKRSQFTTQIDSYDNLSAHCQAWLRVNTIMISLCRDIWTYISMDYFKQTVKKGEIGSSAMPHKVNPIDFENAEGNLGIANALLGHFSEKLPISRLQRDLTDSTVLRNIGVPFAHILIAIQSIEKGMSKLLINKEKIEEDLENNWAVVAEAIQTILRREGIEDAYEQLLNLTRGTEGINKNTIEIFVNNLNVTDKIKKELKVITPYNYTGNALSVISEDTIL